MASSTDRAEVFHDGELAIQRRANLTAQAARHARMLEQNTFSPGMSRFAEERTSLFLTARDPAGGLWTSAVFGTRGFCHAEGSSLTIRATPIVDDPLHPLESGQRVGLLLIEFAKRRRLRVNGVLDHSGSDGLTVAVEQVYGNCPQYINRDIDEPAVELVRPRFTRSTGLSNSQRTAIAHADTFILGSTHPVHGPDTSHRGGPPGFVRVDGDDLWWPDYRGNNVFNSLGNIDVEPATSLLFFDAARGTRLHLSGNARVEWTCPELGDGESDTGRCVRFTPIAVVEGVGA